MRKTAEEERTPIRPPIDLQRVSDWAQSNVAQWEAQGNRIEIFPITTESPKNSVRFNIDGPTTVTTVIVWDSGEWDVTVGEISSGQTTTCGYQPVQSTEEMISKLEGALASMR